MWKNAHKDTTVEPGCTYLQLKTWEEFKLYTKRLMARIHLNLVAAPNGKDHSRQLLYELTRYPACKRWTPSNKHPHAVITYISLQTHLLSVISQTVVCLIQLNTVNAMRSNKKFTPAQFDLLFKQLYFIYYGMAWLGAGFIALQSIVVRLLIWRLDVCYQRETYLLFVHRILTCSLRLLQRISTISLYRVNLFLYNADQSVFVRYELNSICYMKFVLLWIGKMVSASHRRILCFRLHRNVVRLQLLNQGPWLQSCLKFLPRKK